MTILEMAQLRGLNPKWVAGTNQGEYHSPCPDCGGIDRFYIQPFHQMRRCIGSYCCRRCGIYGDAIQFAMKFLDYSFIDAAQAVNAFVENRIIVHLPVRTDCFKPTTLQKPPAGWIGEATKFVNQAHKLLLRKADILAELSKRGLPLDAVIRYKLGWSESNQFFSRVNWGLNECNERSKLWIPQGIVIPTTESNGLVIRLKIRRSYWEPGDRLPKYIAISGSMNGLSLIGSSKQTNMIVVESELDAYAIHYAVGDFVCVVAVGSNIKNPDNVIDRLARNSQPLLICYDNDEAGEKMLIKWRKLYPHATGYPTPIGKDIGEAIQRGFNLREWLSKAIIS